MLEQRWLLHLHARAGDAPVSLCSSRCVDLHYVTKYILSLLLHDVEFQSIDILLMHMVSVSHTSCSVHQGIYATKHQQHRQARCLYEAQTSTSLHLSFASVGDPSVAQTAHFSHCEQLQQALHHWAESSSSTCHYAAAYCCHQPYSGYVLFDHTGLLTLQICSGSYLSKVRCYIQYLQIALALLNYCLACKCKAIPGVFLVDPQHANACLHHWFLWLNAAAALLNVLREGQQHAAMLIGWLSWLI